MARVGLTVGALHCHRNRIQSEHMLQCAWFAAQEGAPDSVVAAALLRGHFLFGPKEGAAERGVDDRHQAPAARELGLWFGPEVIQPIALHVAAERKLCAVERGYLAALSPASQRSLILQGGVMSAQAVEVFDAQPYAHTLCGCGAGTTWESRSTWRRLPGELSAASRLSPDHA